MSIREEGLSVLLVVSLIGIEHTVHPWQELLGTVVSVENDGTVQSAYLLFTIFTNCSHAIDRSNTSDKVSSGNGTSDRCLLLVVCYTFTGKVSGTTLGQLKDDGGVDIPSGL